MQYLNLDALHMLHLGDLFKKIVDILGRIRMDRGGAQEPVFLMSIPDDLHMWPGVANINSSLLSSKA